MAGENETNVKPKTIEVVNNILAIVWDDGHESYFDFEPLRRACPCAYCSGEGSYAGNVNADTKFSETQATLKEIYPVGRYGLTPEWGDGHATGIYGWALLRPERPA